MFQLLMPLSQGRRALELQKSRERLAGVQSRAAEAFKTTDRVMEEQDEMRQRAVRIENVQGILSVAVRKEEKQLVKVEEMKRAITADHALISSYINGD